MHLKNIKRALILLFSLATSTAFASGFQLPYYSISDLGVGFSGQAAVAADATTNYANSAGDVLLPNAQLDVTATAVIARVRFSGTQFAPGIPFIGIPSLDTGKTSTYPAGVLPTIHYVQPISDRLAVGVSLTSPFGLSANYPPDSVVRYDLYYEKAISEELSPSLSFKVNDKLSIGGGPDAMFFQSSLKTKVRTEPLTFADSKLFIDRLDDTAFGWHLGALYQFNPATRAGINFRSQFIQHLEGESNFSTYKGFIPPSKTVSDNTKTKLPLPPNLLLSVYHDMNPRWAVLGSAIYSRWSIYKQNTIENLATLGSTVSLSTPTRYRDGWEYHVGTTYVLNPMLKWRFGIAFVEGVTNPKYRDLVYADNNSVSFATGLHYDQSKNLTFDFGYMYSVMKTSPINNTNPASGVVEVGNSHTTTNQFGMQVNWNIV